jgi:predicted nucleotidyltransferase
MLTLSPPHVRTLAALRTRWPSVRVVLIGAAAVKHHVELARTTSDIDLAVVAEPAHIESLLVPLRWRRDPRVAVRWHGPDGFRADVLPATPEIIASGAISMSGGDRVMSVVGFDLAIDHGVPVELTGTDETIEVASLAALVVLKMVAWLDRSERTKDLGDIARILELGLPSDDDRRWDGAHPVGASAMSYELQSPYFVGHSVGEIAGDQHLQCVRRFLELLMAEDGRHSGQMARAAGFRDGDVRARAMLAAFEAGITAARGAR